MNKDELYMEVIISRNARPDTNVLNCNAVSSTCNKAKEQFYALVNELIKLVPWTNFDEARIYRSDSTLECQLILVENEVCNIIIVFKKIDDDNFDDLRFIVYNSFQPDIETAAYWLKCMLS